MPIVRLDTHGHLYDSYSMREWCDAAFSNLGGGPGIAPVIVVVDRSDQDTYARSRREVPTFGVWRESKATSDQSVSESGEISWGGKTLWILRGVQYVSAEKLEVLGLGVARSIADGAPAQELIDRINGEGGVPCLPWSPGKWLGSRGSVVAGIMRVRSPGTLIFGDIALRTTLGPCSAFLRRARRRGFTVVHGTDPLPRAADCALVGSFGVEFPVGDSISSDTIFPDWIRPCLLSGGPLSPWGRRNSLPLAIRRFLSTL